MTETTKNGNSLTFRWLAGILVTITFALVGVIFWNIFNMVAAHSIDLRDAEARINVAETKVSNIEIRLIRMEDKIDLLLTSR